MTSESDFDKCAAIDLNYNLFIRIGNGIAFNYGDKQVFAIPSCSSTP